MEKKAHKAVLTEKFWFGLDNAAKIFPAVINKDFTAVFSLSVVLNQPVRIQAFLKAVSLSEERFPYYKVQLKKGFFWYFLEHIPLHFPVEFDHKNPCRRFPNNGLLFRIMVSGKRISLEFSHILTDGTGAFEFLKTILALYTKELDLEIPRDFEYLKPGEAIREEEYEDAYKRFFREDIPPMVKRPKAFHLPGQLKSSPRFEMINAILSVKDVRALATEKRVGINDYLVSVYLYILQEIYEELKHNRKYKKCKYIRMQVPVNLRYIFPSKTMRNFSLFVMPGIDLRLGHYSFDEILKTVYHQIRLETDEKLINKNISRNVGSERKIYIKSIPLFLKNFILRMKYLSLGPKQYSGVLTNLGIVRFPPDTENLIDHFVLTPPPPNKMTKVACGIVSFKEKLVVSFGNITKSNELEERFFQFFRDRGLEIHFENNKKYMS